MDFREAAEEFFHRYAEEHGWGYGGIDDFFELKATEGCVNVILIFSDKWTCRGKWVSLEIFSPDRGLRVDLIQGGESPESCFLAYEGYAEVLFRFEFSDGEIGDIDFREYILDNLLATVYEVDLE